MHERHQQPAALPEHIALQGPGVSESKRRLSTPSGAENLAEQSNLSSPLASVGSTRTRQLSIDIPDPAVQRLEL